MQGQARPNQGKASTDEATEGEEEGEGEEDEPALLHQRKCGAELFLISRKQLHF
jgi:hypothetical protein